jgi:hypothetical protein
MRRHAQADNECFDQPFHQTQSYAGAEKPGPKAKAGILR